MQVFHSVTLNVVHYHRVSVISLAAENENFNTPNRELYMVQLLHQIVGQILVIDCDHQSGVQLRSQLSYVNVLHLQEHDTKIKRKEILGTLHVR